LGLAPALVLVSLVAKVPEFVVGCPVMQLAFSLRGFFDRRMLTGVRFGVVSLAKNQVCVNWSRIYEIWSRDLPFSVFIGGRSSWALVVGFDSATIIYNEPDGRVLAEIRAENLENFE
jgi:hypothetical protein